MLLSANAIFSLGIYNIDATGTYLPVRQFNGRGGAPREQTFDYFKLGSINSALKSGYPVLG